MKKAISSLFCLGIATSIFLSGCGGSQSGDTSPRLVPPNYDEKACSGNRPDQGPTALMDNRHQTDFIRGPLNKTYDRYDLEAVFDASALSTTEYVRSLGIQLFRIPRSNIAGACQTFYNLPPAPEPLQNLWNRASGGIGGSFRLAGLYFDNCGNGCREYAVLKPTILVDEASDRWTLVHELMHYNFNQGRAADRSRSSYHALKQQMQRSLTSIEKSLQILKSTPNREELEIAAQESEILARTAYDLAVMSLLEEVALESLLIREWAADRFIQSNQWAPQSSLKYMENARRGGLNELNQVSSLIQSLRQIATKDNWPEALSSLNSAEKIMTKANTETAKLIQEARLLVKAKLSGHGPSEAEEDFGWQNMDIHSHQHLDQLEGAETLREMSTRLKKMRELYRL